mgnify:CR=1 FL=1
MEVKEAKIIVRYWIIPITYDNWLVCHGELIYGFRESLENLIRAEDVITFYMMKSRYRNPDYTACFVGAYEVIGKWFREDKPLWPDEKGVGKILYPYRVKIRLVKDGKVKAEELIGRLSFIKNKGRWQVYFRGCPANFRKPVSEEDTRLIIESLR